MHSLRQGDEMSLKEYLQGLWDDRGPIAIFLAVVLLAIFFGDWS